MFEIALMYKEIFAWFKKNTKGKVERFPPPTPYEWQTEKDICYSLALFNRATEAFSARCYVVANLYFYKVREMRLALRKCSLVGLKKWQRIRF